MTQVTLDIKAWGNGLGVRLPATIAREANIHAHQKVEISTTPTGQIIITPIHEESLTLEQRLAIYQPNIDGAEAMQTSSILGAESW